MPRVVVCDVHERASGVPVWLERLGVDVRVECMKVGDYRVAPGALVERKTVRSVHTAVVEGTFWAQIGRLRRNTREAFLLIEGANLDHGSLSPASIRGVCLAVMEQGIRLIRATTPHDSALWLMRLGARSEAVRGRATRPVHDQARNVPPELVAEAMLSAVPTISVRTARALLTHFGSLHAIASATEDHLRDVKGVGPARAAALVRALGRASPRSGEGRPTASAGVLPSAGPVALGGEVAVP
jgi:ERCC4-type nuclease